MQRNLCAYLAVVGLALFFSGCAFGTPEECQVDQDCDTGNECHLGTCRPICGNGVLDSQETCDPPETCPSSCDDADPCTVDSMRGSAEQCDVVCDHQAITQCIGNDGCCLPACNSLNDSDCAATCGNGLIEAGETCDPPSTCPANCDDGNVCTTDTTVGSAAQCNLQCDHQPVTACLSGDNCCPSGCVVATDNDCQPHCGNGALDPGEQCDDANDLDLDGCFQCQLVEFQVPSDASRVINQYAEDVVATPAGDIVFSWVSSASGTSQLFTRILTAQGAFAGNDQLAGGADNNAMFSMANSSSQYALVWFRYPSYFTVRRYNLDGSALGNSLSVIGNATNSIDFPDIAVDDQGRFIVSWDYSSSVFTTSAYGKYFNADGSSVGDAFHLFPDVDGLTGRLVVRMSGSGHYLAARPYLSNDHSLQGRFYDPDTAQLGDVMQLLANVDYSYTAVAANQAGHFVVAASDWSIDAIAFRLFDETGSALSSQLSLDTSAFGYPHWLDVAIDQSGNFVIVWLTDTSIVGQRFTKAGNKTGSIFTVNRSISVITSDPDNYKTLKVAMDPDGAFVVVFITKKDQKYILLAQRFAANATPLGLKPW